MSKSITLSPSEELIEQHYAARQKPTSSWSLIPQPDYVVRTQEEAALALEVLIKKLHQKSKKIESHLKSDKSDEKKLKAIRAIDRDVTELIRDSQLQDCGNNTRAMSFIHQKIADALDEVYFETSPVTDPDSDPKPG